MLLRMQGALVAVMVIVSCARPYHEPNEHYIAANIKLPYWQEAQAGFTDAAASLGVKAEMAGPDSFSPNDELSAFQNAVAQHPSGILVSATGADLFKGAIDTAISQGIPVICVDADAPDSRRVLFIGTDNFRAGGESARRMAETPKKYPGIKITATLDDKGDVDGTDQVSIMNLRSAIVRAAAKEDFKVGTSSDEKYFYVWKDESRQP
jgi:ABC-type sugar transport system substrate-binding protein